MRKAGKQRVEYGDWQTPIALASQVVDLLQRKGIVPGEVVEPTCGRGAFLSAAATAWPQARLRGWDVNSDHVAAARNSLGGRAELEVADFFTAPWEKLLRAADEPLLVLGNPPWVTSSELGSLRSSNLPRKDNYKALVGLDAITGKSNFDVSEWMLVRLLEALRTHSSFTMAMLCKTAVARRIMEHTARTRLPVLGEMRGIDAQQHFGASVDAVLLILSSEAERPTEEVSWSVYQSLSASSPVRTIGFVSGTLCSDIDGFHRTRDLEGNSVPEWRSGLKHDCSSVMEFKSAGDGLINGAGERVDLEPRFVYPLLKGSDLANERLGIKRAVLVPQRRLGEDTCTIRELAPKTWAYLMGHRESLDGRRSSIYRGQPAFAVFGVGDYTFAPWKVAIAGLYKRLVFVLVGPNEGRPVVLDDTCYGLPFERREDAERAMTALESDEARTFFESRVFWDAKRPINKSLLQSLDLPKLEYRLGLRDTMPVGGAADAQQTLML